MVIPCISITVGERAAVEFGLHLTPVVHDVGRGHSHNGQAEAVDVHLSGMAVIQYRACLWVKRSAMLVNHLALGKLGAFHIEHGFGGMHVGVEGGQHDGALQTLVLTGTFTLHCGIQLRVEGGLDHRLRAHRQGDVNRLFGSAICQALNQRDGDGIPSGVGTEAVLIGEAEGHRRHLHVIRAIVLHVLGDVAVGAAADDVVRNLSVGALHSRARHDDETEVLVGVLGELADFGAVR